MSASESLSLAKARATLLELVARLFIEELDEEARDALRHPDIMAVLDSLEPGVRDYLDSGEWTKAQWDLCAADFCHLFLTNKETAPFASAWMGDEPSVYGAELTALIDQWCERLELSINGGPWGNVPKDHVAVLTGLVAHSLHKTGPAAQALAEDILSRGLRPWIHRFIAAVSAATQNPLYKAAVQLLDIALKNSEDV
jgi:TorA maturation chaperone TorD